LGLVKMFTLHEMWEYSAVVGQAEDEYLPDVPESLPHCFELEEE